MRAVERFEGGHEAKFSTYACWWIWSFMKRALIDRGRLVRLPVHFAERIPALLRARRALTREHDGAPPTVTELAENLGWRVEHVIFALQSLDNPLSIDAPIGDGHPLSPSACKARRRTNPTSQLLANKSSVFFRDSSTPSARSSASFSGSALAWAVVRHAPSRKLEKKWA